MANDYNPNNINSSMSSNLHDAGVSPSLLLLQRQVGALQKELSSKLEANFELDAMVATMQAEMTHTIASASSKEEWHSKLQHELRMAQQEARQSHQQAAKRQKLQHQVSQQNQAATSAFSKSRLPPAAQQEPNAGPSEMFQKTSHPYPVTPSEDSCTDQQLPSCGQVLSRNLLETCSLGSVKSAACVQFLTYIASNPQTRWVETQLVWYLVHATVRQFEVVYRQSQGRAEVPQLEVCLQLLQHALTLSSTGREDVRQQFLGEASDSGSSHAPHPSIRIRKNGDTLVDTPPHAIEATTMQTSLWTLLGSSSSSASSQYSQSTTPDRSELANRLVEGLLRRLTHPRSVHIIFTLIQGSDSEKWHTACHAQVVEALKHSMAYQLRSEDPYEFDCGEPAPPPPSTPPALRRIKHIEEFSYEDMFLEISTLLPALLVLQQRLLLQTTTQHYSSSINHSHDFFSSPDGRACVHGMLDVLTSSILQESQQQWELAEPYYLESIKWLQQVAGSPEGMALLRSRVPGISGGNNNSDVSSSSTTTTMPNAIDVAITHMHKLTVTTDDDSMIHKKKDMVLVQNCIEAWIRFLHQVLLYCQQPLPPPGAVTPPSSPVVTFRSLLLLDAQGLFTSACGLLLANPLEKTPTARVSTTSICDECKNMIRSQLEELSLDEEEEEQHSTTKKTAEGTEKSFSSATDRP
jgi:hypothetical protein